MIVYQITCIPSGRSYIGITEGTIKTRWKDHCSAAGRGDGRVLCNAIRKYGRAAFEIIEILHVLPGQSPDVLFEMEQFLIKDRGTKAPHGYNMTDGGEGNSGLEVSEETRRKISAGNKGKLVSAEHREKLRQARLGAGSYNYGKKQSPELVAKRNAAIREYWKTHRHPAFGQKANPEHVEKRRLARAANPWKMPEEIRLRMSETRRGANNPMVRTAWKRNALKAIAKLNPHNIAYVN